MAIPPRSPVANALNALLMFAVAVPWLVFQTRFAGECASTTTIDASSSSLLDAWTTLPDDASALSVAGWCTYGRAHPIALANVLFFLNITLLFWIISVLQGNTWVRLPPTKVSVAHMCPCAAH
jgi:hypothetical protein